MNKKDLTKFYSKPLGEPFKPKIDSKKQEIFERGAEKHCGHFGCQHDSNGEIAISFCSHPDNLTETEGNCTPKLCPLPIHFHDKKERNEIIHVKKG